MNVLLESQASSSVSLQPTVSCYCCSAITLTGNHHGNGTCYVVLSNPAGRIQLPHSACTPTSIRYIHTQKKKVYYFIKSPRQNNTTEHFTIRQGSMVILFRKLDLSTEESFFSLMNVQTRRHVDLCASLFKHLFLMKSQSLYGWNDERTLATLWSDQNE